MNKIYKIGIIGLGQIGNYLYRELNLKKKYIETKTGKKIQIIGISAKNKNKRRKYKIDKNIFQKVTIFDVYEGDKLPDNKKSIAFRVLLQPQNKTFTDEEIDSLSKQIIDLVTKSFEASIR